MTLVLDIPQIRDWVAEAGDIARHYFKHTTPEWKGAANPVTIADREIERLLTGKILSAYPGHGLIGEEYGVQASDQDYLWAIDPIDGTRSYVEGLPSWSISVGLLYRRVPVFGLIYMPLYDDWTYTDGDDVISNDISIRDCLKSAWNADSYLLARSDFNAWYDIRFTRVMALGSTASHLAYTARGAALAMVTHGSYLWDIAAGMAILARQGGEFRLLSGELIDFTHRDLTQRIDEIYVAGHSQVVERLLPLIQWRERPYHHPAW